MTASSGIERAITEVEGGVEVALHVQPGAGRNAVVGSYGDSVKVRVGAPPVGGRANAAVVALLADVLGVRDRDVELVAGQTGRNKRVRVAGVTAEVARTAIERATVRVPGEKRR